MTMHAYLLVLPAGSESLQVILVIGFVVVPNEELRRP